MYIYWDNNRVIVTEQDIVLDNLPAAFDGFSILQLTDLHEKQFGNGQKRLLEKINHTDYDALVITGDMLNEESSEHYEPFYTLLEGIEDKTHAYFVEGNDDAFSYEIKSDVQKSTFIQGIEDRGVQFLETMDTLEKDGESLHFVNFELAIITSPEHIGKINGTYQPDYVTDPVYKRYQQARWKEMDLNKIDEERVIALNHYPVVEARVDYIKQDPKTEWRDIDLLLAGHYHGGQFRLPFLGGLFVPEPWNERKLFPPRDRVKGLWDHHDTKQYVSAGLGSSADIPLLKFRLFNPPEINLLKLTQSD